MLLPLPDSFPPTDARFLNLKTHTHRQRIQFFARRLRDNLEDAMKKTGLDYFNEKQDEQRAYDAFFEEMRLRTDASGVSPNQPLTVFEPMDFMGLSDSSSSDGL